MSDRTVYMLTTVDNPYSPFTQFVQWYNFDTSHGYHSAEVLARVVNSSDELSDRDYVLESNRAIDEIVSINASGMWRKVSEDSFPSP